MTQQLSELERDELAESLSVDGHVEVMFAGSERLRYMPGVPSTWQKALASRENAPYQVLDLWQPLRRLLPRTVEILKSRLVDVLLASLGASRYSLVYVFRQEGEVMAQIGYLPATEAQFVSIPGKLRTLLAPFYLVHDGWVDIHSRDGGPLPISEWISFKAGSTAGPTLLATYSNGGHFAGFDLSDPLLTPYGLWPEDDEVQKLNDFWTHVDDQIAASLEDCDQELKGSGMLRRKHPSPHNHNVVYE